MKTKEILLQKQKELHKLRESYKKPIHNIDRMLMSIQKNLGKIEERERIKNVEGKKGDWYKHDKLESYMYIMSRSSNCMVTFLSIQFFKDAIHVQTGSYMLPFSPEWKKHEVPNLAIFGNKTINFIQEHMLCRT